MEIKYMREAIKEALKGQDIDEVPIGAVIVLDDKIIARAHNLKEKNKCSNYHAEMIAIEKACKKLNNWHLDGCDIYVTLEPCPMCAGALINARVAHVYFGAFDPKAGCCGSLYNLPEDKRFNHRPIVNGGILCDECGKLLSNYFKEKRKKC